MEELTLTHIILLAITGIWGGAVNAAAGGGTYFSFPALIFVGLPPILANTTNKVAICLGSMASVGGFWQEIKKHKDRLPALLAAALVGSVCGSLLLLQTPAETFSFLVPWLMLGATLLFAFGRHMVDWLQQRLKRQTGSRFLSLFGQWLIGGYGGFFGAGIGIMLMALYELMGIRNIHEMNGLKAIIAGLGHVVSVITFLIAGAIMWTAAIPLSVGYVIGGYYGALLTKRMSQTLIRRLIIAYGLGVSAWFFLQ